MKSAVRECRFEQVGIHRQCLSSTQQFGKNQRATIQADQDASIRAQDPESTLQQVHQWHFARHDRSLQHAESMQGFVGNA